MDILKHFVENETLKNAVYSYFEETLKEEILTRAFAEKEIKGYVEAKRILDKTFNNLEGKYGKQNRSTQDPR
jgi:hypothetical protein